MWILLKQETVRGSGITRAICNGVHLAPDRQPCQHPTAQFFTGRIPFLPSNQQRQSTEGKQGRYAGKLQHRHNGAVLLARNNNNNNDRLTAFDPGQPG